MTVETQADTVVANGNDSATTFSFSPLVIYASDELLVVHVDADGVETVLTEGTGTDKYSVSVSSYPGTGSVEYPETLGTELATGEKLYIKRVLTLENSSDLENQGGYYPDVQEDSFDKAVMIDIQQQEEIDRCFKLPLSDNGDTVEVGIASERVNKYMYFDSDGNLSLTGSTEIDQISVVDGTAADPSITFTDDDDTGFYRIAANTLGIATGGTLRITIGATGFVGIGQSSPTALLHVGNSALQYSTTIGTRTPGNQIEFGHNNTGGYGSVIGANVGNGNPFIAFNAGAGATDNTFKTFGLKGSVLQSDISGGFLFNTIENTSADNQTATTILKIVTASAAVNFFTITPAATGSNQIVLLGVGNSTDTNVGIGLSTKGTGNVQIGSSLSAGANPSRKLQVQPDSNTKAAIGLQSFGATASQQCFMDWLMSTGATLAYIGQLSTTASPFLYGTNTSHDFMTGSGSFGSGNLQVQIPHVASAVNYAQISGAVTGSGVSFSAAGSDTDIDINFIPKGSGVLSFGTHSAIGAETVTGFITIKDEGGTSRKVAIVS